MGSERLPKGRIREELDGLVLGGRYIIDRVLARRPLVVVHRAYDLRGSKPVVLELLDETLVHDPGMMPRLAEEAVRGTALVHDSIVPFYGLERDGPLLFSVRDYVDGISLKEYLARVGRPLALYEVAQIVEQAGAALHYAHREGVLHRSINPGNILLRFDGRVFLLGFGLPSLAGISSETEVDPSYLSPEQCCGQKIDHRTDVYALASVAYTLCVGRSAFSGQNEAAPGSTDWERICWQHVNEPPPFASKLNPDLPRDVAWVLSRGMAKRPEERFRSAAEFTYAMKRAMKEAGLDLDAMLSEPPSWRRPPEVITPPRIQRSSARPSKTKGSLVFWLIGIVLVVVSVWGVLITMLLGTFEQRSVTTVSPERPSLVEPLIESLIAPTWTPPMIPTPTATRARTGVVEIPTPTVPVPGAIPFNGLRALTTQYDWATYLSQVTWRSYTDPRFGFALVHPEGWSVQQGENVVRLYMPERDVGVAICSCGTRVADAGQWAGRFFELLKRDYPEIREVEQRPYGGGWLATLAQIPQNDDDIQVVVLSFGQGQRGYAVAFTAWASDWQGIKPVFDRMARDMRFP